MFASAGHTAEPHPAKEWVDRSAAQVRTDPTESARAAGVALDLLAVHPNADLEIEARTLLCDHLSERDEAAAKAEVARARALLPQAKREGLESGVLTCEGTIAETAGDNGAARDYYDRAVAVATKANDTKSLAGALYARGYLLGVQGEFAIGLGDLKRAQALYDAAGLNDYSLTTLNSIAILYNRMGDYEQARHIYERAVRAQEAAGMTRELGVTLHNLGRAHENLSEWEAARAAFSRSYELSRELKYPRGEAYAVRGLAAIANATGDPNDALSLLERAAELQKQTPDARLYAQIQLARGAALHQTNRPNDAASALREALQVFQTTESMIELRATYAALASVEAELGNWREAYKYRSLAQETSERMLRNQLDQRFTSLKVEFDTAAKEKENELLLRENEANQNALEQERRASRLLAIVIGLTVILAGLLGVLAIHQWRTTRRMHTLAMTDELTGVPNRRAVLSKLEPVLVGGGPCALLIVDIDHFKSINDQHGHAEGDEALKLVARQLRAFAAEPAFIGRLGGEEFVIVLPGADLERAMRDADQLRESVMTIDSRRWLKDRRITVSIGVTTSKAHGDTLSTMLQRADAALYEAKRSGRNCVKAQLAPSENSSSSQDANGWAYAAGTNSEAAS